MSNKSSWQKYHDGDNISDDELLGMIEQTKAAVPYLESRLPQFYLAFKETVNTLHALERYCEYRKNSKQS